MSAPSQPPVGFITIIAKNYLAQARVLMAAIEEHHPGAPRLVVLACEPEGCFDPEHEPFRMIRSSDLDLPDSRWFHFRYDTLELMTAVKPFAMRKALQMLGVESVIYLDADMRLYAPLDPVLDALSEASIVLTPHLLSRVDTDGLAIERQLLRTGAYNLGFVAVRGNGIGKSFLSWWCDRLAEHCLIDLAGGLFVDQKWADLVPGMFDGVRILRAPGLNVAWWNLRERPLSAEGGSHRAAGEPLYLFHFSGFDPEQPESLSKHAASDRAAELGEARPLLADHAQLLLSSGYIESSVWSPAFESFEDGSAIPPAVRSVLRLEPALQQAIDDPFSMPGREKIFEFWNRQVSAPGGAGFLTRLAYRIYQSEPQIQAAMPNVFGAHREAYVAWFVSEGAARYGLPPELTAPLKLTSLDLGQALLTPLALRIYESRKDLQRKFPDPFGEDALGLLTWLLTYGENECDIDEANRQAFLREFERLVGQLPSPLQRWRRRGRRALLAHSAGHR